MLQYDSIPSRWTHWTVSAALLIGALAIRPAIASATGSERVESSTSTTETTANLSGSDLRQFLLAKGYEPASINPSAAASEPEAVSDEVVLADGDVIRGRIIEANEQEVVLVHPVFAEMRIPRERIVAIRREAPRRGASGFGEVITGAGVRPPNSLGPGTSPGTREATMESSQAEAGAQDEGTTNEDGEQGQSVASTLVEVSNWTFVLGTAFGYVENVNTELNLRLSAQAEHESEFARLRINTAYFLNSSNDEIVDNDFLLNSTQDWFINEESDWSLFARGTYQWDAFETWEHRLSGYVGPSFQVTSTEDLEVCESAWGPPTSTRSPRPCPRR